MYREWKKSGEGSSLNKVKDKGNGGDFKIIRPPTSTLSSPLLLILLLILLLHLLMGKLLHKILYGNWTSSSIFQFMMGSSMLKILKIIFSRWKSIIVCSRSLFFFTTGSRIPMVSGSAMSRIEQC